jgi:type IV secretion/conjugal transfer VirB4 family ATPase
MLRLNEHRMRPHGLADLLLYDSLVDDGILLLQDGALLAAWSFRGPDMGSSTHAEMAALSARLNAVLRLGSGWMVQCDAIRCQAPEYPGDGAFPDPVTRIIDEERRMQFLAEGAHFESEYFLALTYLPPAASEEKVKGWMFDGRAQSQDAPARKALDDFTSRIANFKDRFSSIFRVQRLRGMRFENEGGFPRVHDGLLRYVRRCVTGDDYPFEQPDIPVYLADILGSRDFVAGIEPKIGSRHVRAIAIDGFPKASYPAILSALDTLPIEYRWNTRAILLDPEEARAVLDKTRRKWRSRMRGWKDQVFRTQTGPVNLHAQEMAADAEEAMGVASSGDVQFALYSSNIICMAQDREAVDANASLVVKTIQNLGFDCRIETVNAVEAWRGTLPGDGYRNVRRVLLHTLNLADMLPITSVWSGLRENPSSLMPPGSPPLLYAATSGSTPFRFNMHVADVGHTLMVGPTGAGKSTLLALMVAQWFRYPQAQVFAFDKGYSLYMLTRAAGGEFYDIAGERTPLAFCPLREIDSDAELAWAVDWLEALCVMQGLELSPKQRNALTAAVQELRLSPTRTLSEFCANVQDLEIRDALQYYTLAGPMGALLDADEDMLGSGRFLTFETESLMSVGDKAVVAVLLYLFRQIERRLDGSPTLVPLDEAWVYLGHDLFRNRLRDWLKTMRKRNGVVLLATQSLSDIFNSSIKDVVLESCPTKILLPNTEARNPASLGFYQSIGLNERELQIIQTSLPKREYYVISPLGRRLISLGLGAVGLAFVGINGREERQRAEKVMEASGDRWQAAWLRQRGIPDWAEYYEALIEAERSSSCAVV